MYESVHRKYTDAHNPATKDSSFVDIRAVGGAEEPISRIVPPPLLLGVGLEWKLVEVEAGYAEGSVGQAGFEFVSGVTVVGITTVVVPEGDVDEVVLVKTDFVIVKIEDDVGEIVAFEGTSLMTVFVAVAPADPPSLSLSPPG